MILLPEVIRILEKSPLPLLNAVESPTSGKPVSRHRGGGFCCEDVQCRVAVVVRKKLQRSVMPDEGLGQVAATIIVRYIFTDESQDGNQLPHPCRPSCFAASDALPYPFQQL
jgi:hypothetical protein